MKFLLTNDDGFDADGITVLSQAAQALGSVCVVAPDEHLSGCSHQVTDRRPIRVQPRREDHFSIDAYPADCVRLGLTRLFEDVDWVLSGVNHGGNLGVDLFLSGTVAAVREATLLGKPAIAFSQYRRNRHLPCNWDWTAQQVERILPMLLEQELPPGCFWNVNFPHPNVHPSPEVVFCEPERQPLQVQYQSNGDSVQYVGVYQERPQTAGRDVAVCFGGQIAISQISVFG
ncbi:MAG: 5'/3'-nucleotidase SurE [Planctomycetaceae bacterium]|nr:5'/3'-nucleotidase SurE [Planctomycetaceae bacterium]